MIGALKLSLWKAREGARRALFGPPADPAHVTPALLGFWRAHGRDWARDEASAEDLRAVAAIARRARFGGARRARAAFEAIWAAGFSAGDGPDWRVIPDHLPDAAWLAFAQGAAEVFQAKANR